MSLVIDSDTNSEMRSDMHPDKAPAQDLGHGFRDSDVHSGTDSHMHFDMNSGLDLGTYSNRK